MPKRQQDAQARIACLWLGDSPSLEAWEQMLEALGEFSPRIEDAGPAPSEGLLVYLDARGITPRYESEPAWCEALIAVVETMLSPSIRLGICGTKFSAWIAALSASKEARYQVICQPSAAFLASQPVELLPLDKETQRRLRLLGLRTMKQFAALPRTSVAEQFGPESLLAYQWAKGADMRTVQGRRRQMVEARHLFEMPESRMAALIEAAQQLCQRAQEELPPPRDAWVIRWVTMDLALNAGQLLQRTSWLGKMPVAEALAPLLRNMLTALRGEEGWVEEMGVRLLGVEPVVGRQLDMLTHTEARQRLESSLEALNKRYSAECIAWPILLEDSAPLAAERYGLRAYSP